MPRNLNIKPRKKQTSSVYKKISTSLHLGKVDNSGTITDAIIYSIGEGLIIADEYGIISHINRPALDILGFDRSELEGAWLPQVIPSYDKAGNKISASERPAARALLTGEPVAEVVNYKKKDGSLVSVFGTASPFLINDKPTGVIIVFRDVSKEMQIEHAKDEFVSLASHQLRTPLTSIRYFAELLKEPGYGKLSKSQLNHIDKILFSTDRMINLVSELLNISRLNLGKLEINPVPTDLNNLIQNRVLEAEPLARTKKIKLNFINKLKKSEVVLIDRNLLGQAIHNLLSNAIRYSPEKSKVDIIITKSKQDYQIAVADKGIGIPLSARPRIYERFFRADNAVKTLSEGNGLGLYLVKYIAEASGGKTWYKSTENKGTTFYITIPLSGMTASDDSRV